MVGKSDFKENHKSNLDLDLGLLNIENNWIFGINSEIGKKFENLDKNWKFGKNFEFGKFEKRFGNFG